MKRLVRSLALSLAGLLLGVAPDAGAQTSRPLIAFGDSITSGFGDTGVDCELPETFAGYAPRLRSALGARGIATAVDNEGVCGETTAEALSRIDPVLAGARDVGLLLLMEGTNDISAGVSVETIRFNMAEMARRGEGYRLESVLAGPVPRGPDSGRDNNNANTFALGEAMRADASAAGRAYADAFHALFDQPDVFEQLYADPFHPNADGYDLVADAFLQPALDAYARVGQPDEGPCSPTPSRLCLNRGRFAITVDWTKPDGERGIGRAQNLTEDSGYFYFFRDSNIELVIKVLDGRHSNGHFWVFYGALSNVEYTITVRDSETGIIKRYLNPGGTFASVGDTQAFAVPPDVVRPPMANTAPVAQALLVASPLPMPSVPGTIAARRPGVRGIAGCVEDRQTLCLNDRRFAVEVSWQTPSGQQGEGAAQPRTGDTGMFYFFRESNIELIVKVLDGRLSNGHFWVFYGALSNVAYTLRVTDTLTGREKLYLNLAGHFASVGDTQAFAALPGG